MRARNPWIMYPISSVAYWSPQKAKRNLAKKEARAGWKDSFYPGISYSDTAVNRWHFCQEKQGGVSNSVFCASAARCNCWQKVINAKQKASKPLSFDAFYWSCWADLNRRPHPYQIKKCVFRWSSLIPICPFWSEKLLETTYLAGFQNLFIPAYPPWSAICFQNVPKTLPVFTICSHGLVHRGIRLHWKSVYVEHLVFRGFYASGEILLQSDFGEFHLQSHMPNMRFVPKCSQSCTQDLPIISNCDVQTQIKASFHSILSDIKLQMRESRRLLSCW